MVFTFWVRGEVRNYVILSIRNLERFDNLFLKRICEEVEERESFEMFFRV